MHVYSVSGGDEGMRERALFSVCPPTNEEQTVVTSTLPDANSLACLKLLYTTV